MSSSDDSIVRRDRWLGLPRTLPARFSGIPATIIDLGPDSLLFEHLRDLGTEPFPIEFMWQGEKVELLCRWMRVVEEFWDGDVKGNIYESELEIEKASENFSRLIDSFRKQVERALEANLEGESEANLLEGGASIADLGAARRERMQGFVTWHLTAEGWQRETNASPEQPEDGFTVAAHEDEEQVRLLRLAYEETNPEGRKMMRHFAALALRPWS